MKKRTKIACLIGVFAVALGSCRKSETVIPQSDELLKSKGKHSVSSGADGKWDLLGYGYDVTVDVSDPNSTSDALVIDMKRFEADYLTRIDVNNTGSGTHDYYVGATALDYLKDVTKKRSWGIGATLGSKEAKFFSGSLNRNKSDQTISKFSSRYSYASFEAFRVVRRLRFTGDVPVSLLVNYLTPEFTNNVASLDAKSLVERYGTHVLLDISIGGKLRMDYSAVITKESEYEKKVRGTKVGLLGSVVKVVGINFDSDVSKEEITQTTRESNSKQYTLQFYGGTNSGRTISLDAEGNSSESINIGSWEQSVNTSNSALVHVNNAVPIYEFIVDPTKRNQVMAAVDRYIEDHQITELGELPVYDYWSQKASHHMYTMDRSIPWENDGYVFNGLAFYAFNTQQPGTDAVHDFWRGYDTHHLLSIDRYGYPFEKEKYVYNGIVTYAYKTQVPGTQPVHNYWRQKDSHHLYTIDRNDYPYEQNGYVYNGISFYAYPRN